MESGKGYTDCNQKIIRMRLPQGKSLGMGGRHMLEETLTLMSYKAAPTASPSPVSGLVCS